MRRLTHKKTVAVAVTAVLTLSGGGIAFAYFTSGGSGVGSAAVGSAPAGAFDITTTGPTDPVLPGNGPQTFDVQVANTTGQDEYVGTVYVSIATDTDNGDVTTADGIDIPDCLASWFTVTPSVDVDQVVAAGNAVTSGDTPSIEMPAAPVDQDACQNAAVGINFTTTGS
jgi:hypothetical protein